MAVEAYLTRRWLRAAITALLDHAQLQQCNASWWRTSISSTPALPGAKPWAAAGAGNGYAAPSLASPPGDSVPGSPGWRHGAASR